MFRCDNCGSGYTTQTASTWDFCPRCLAKSKEKIPLSFELGWRSSSLRKQMAAEAGQTTDSTAGEGVAGTASVEAT
jgi:hypothetical protein